MKTGLSFLQTIAFALALARWMPLSAQTQNAGELKPPPQTNRDEPVFNFPGGTPRDFMAAVEKHFKADWLSIASIPREMENVRVPRLRIPPGPVFLFGSPGAPNELLSIVMLYNRLAEREPQLGTLVVEAPLNHPEKPYAVMLVPNKSAVIALAQMKTKAFPLRGIPEKDWATLADEVLLTANEARARGATLHDAIGWPEELSLPYTVTIHPGSALLVVMGSESFVEMADSIATAFQANQRGVVQSVAAASQASPCAPEAKRRFTVLGQVNRPGSYEIPSGDRLGLLEALAMAGGYTRIGNPRKITVQRIVGGENKIFKDLDAEAMAKKEDSKPFEILANDVITVGEKWIN